MALSKYATYFSPRTLTLYYNAPLPPFWGTPWVAMRVEHYEPSTQRVSE